MGKRLVSQAEEMWIKIEWLGMIIEEGRVSMDSGKLWGIKKWPVPNTVKQVRGFLRFRNFYRRFIRHFSEIAKPLNDLLKKDQRFKWTEACQNSFDELKKCFTEEPVLAMPDQTKPFQIECDASKYASGAVLTQLDSNGDWHPCAFISKTTSTLYQLPQRRWATAPAAPALSFFNYHHHHNCTNDDNND